MANNAYFKSWNDIIMGNATVFNDLPPVVHVFDGGPSGSGILDPAREVCIISRTFTTVLLTLPLGQKPHQAFRLCVQDDPADEMG